MERITACLANIVHWHPGLAATMMDPDFLVFGTDTGDVIVVQIVA